MKKSILLLYLLLFFRLGCVLSQDAMACSNATFICNNYVFSLSQTLVNGLTGSLSVSNPSVNPQGVNWGCQQSYALNPNWLTFTILNSGNLGFVIGYQFSQYPQMGFYDWDLWMYTPNTCNGIFANTWAPVACNWNYTNSGGTGMYPLTSGANPGNFQPSISVNAGDQFLLLISNYSNVNAQVIFQSTGTASLTCNVATLVQNFNKDGSVVVFPNPVTNELKLKFETDLEKQIELITPEGKILYQHKVNTNESTLKIEELSRGVYFLKVEEGTKSSWHKVIKE